MILTKFRGASSHFSFDHFYNDEDDDDDTDDDDDDDEDDDDDKNQVDQPVLPPVLVPKNFPGEVAPL